MSCRTILRELWAFRLTIIIILTPLVLLPIPFSIPGTEARCGYCVILMAVYWMTEALPLAVTALLPVVLFPLMGILDSKQTASTYLKDINMLFIGGLVVAVAVEVVNLHKRIALRVMTIAGSEPRWLMLGIMTTTFFLSMWISNTASTAMMLPIVLATTNELVSLKGRARKLSQTFPADIGYGLDNVNSDKKACLENGGKELQGDDNPAFERDEGPYIIDTRFSSQQSIMENLEKMRVNMKQPNSTLPEDKRAFVNIGSDSYEETPEDVRLKKGMILAIAYSASVGGTATLTGTPPNLVMSAVIDRMFSEEAGVTFASFFFFGAPTAVVMLILAWIWLQIWFLGWRTLCGCCAKTTNANIKRSVNKIIREEYNKLGRMKFNEIVVLICFIILVILWFSRDPKFAPGWGSGFYYSPPNNPDKKPYQFPSDATSAIFIGVLLFILPNDVPNFLCLRRRNDMSEPGPRPSILNWKTLQHKMPWDVVFLMGGGFAMAKGVEVSGLSLWVGEGLKSVLGGMPIWVIIAIVAAIVACITEVASNTATANIMLPLMPPLALGLGVHPMLLMYPATIAASFSFMLPAATPPNAVVFSSGYLRVIDMVVAGIVMNILGIVVITIAVNTYGVYVFDWGTIPSWATEAPESTTALLTTTVATVASTLNDTITSVINA